MSRFNKKFSIIPYASITTDMVNNSTHSDKDHMRRAVRGQDDVIVVYYEANRSTYTDYPMKDFETEYHNYTSSIHFNTYKADETVDFVEIKGDIKDSSSSEIYDVEITTAGTGYSAGTLTATGGGAGGGFKGTYSVSGGAITRMIILNMGSGYTSTPNIVISHAGNSDAVLTPRLRGEASEGNTRVLDMSLKDDLTYASTLTVDKNSTATATATARGLIVDLDHTGISASGQTVSNIGLDIDVNSNAPTMVGTVNNTGIDITCRGGTSGTQTSTGLNIVTRDSDTNDGIHIKASDTHLKLIAGADNDDYATLAVADTGDLTIATVGDGTTDSDLILDVDGDIVLDSANGVFISKNNGTEFSAANSSYAGMILGYTKISNTTASPGQDVIVIGNSFVTLQTAQGTNVSIVFKAPPSGSIEISFSANIYASSKEVAFSLSDNATYNELHAQYTYDFSCWKSDETDRDILDVRWALTSLTPGTSYTYYIGARASSASAYMYHGTDRAGAHSPPIIVKAVALPATITTGG